MSRLRFPKKAILLAAGFGTRMRPLSYSTPKPLLPIWNCPSIDRTMAMLQAWGVQDFLVNVHHASAELFDHLRTKSLREGVRIAISYEPEILGTGGAVDRARWFVSDAPFWMVNTDVVASVRPNALVRALACPNTAAALWVTDRLGPRTVEVSSEGVITNFRSTQAGASGTYTFCGLQLISPALLRFIAFGEFSTIVAAYESAIRKGHVVRGVSVSDSLWADVGRPEDFLETHRRLLAAEDEGAVRAARSTRQMARRAGAALQGVGCVAPCVQLSRGAALQDCVVMRGTRLGRQARLSDIIVGPDVHLNRHLRGGMVCRARDLPEESAESLVLAQLKMPREQALIHNLAGRGSDRQFTRLMSGPRSVMLVRYGTERPENAHYAEHARTLKRAGVRVPEVLFENAKARWAVFEDVGDVALQERRARLGRRALINAYRAVLEMVVRLHAHPKRLLRGTLQAPFSDALYAWEHELFEKHFLTRLAPSSTPGQRRSIRRELKRVSATLENLPHVLLHRDLQSSNILIHRGEYVLIDFQGMRLGPAVYDLASLLCDPYVMLPYDVQHALLATYREQSGQRGISEDLFWTGAIQRLVQALGAYGRLCAIPGAERFAGYIEPALQMLRRALSHATIDLPVLRQTADACLNGLRTER